MNADTDPRATGTSWLQVSIRFDDYTAAEHTAVAHLGPAITDAEAAGLVVSWSFIRKRPCWRLRYLPPHQQAEQDAQAFIHQSLDTLHKSGRIAQWVQTVYEPEVHAFGGTAAMDVAHDLFHRDSQHILDYLGSTRAATRRGDKRRELSILLCMTLMRGAGQDWYEQGDIWARVTENRPLPPGTSLNRVRGIESDLRRLMTVDPGPASTLVSQDGPLTYLADWAAAFNSAGTTLGDLVRDGTLRRGVRAVLTHHVIFHWNRIGLPYETQSVLAHAARAVVLGE